MKKIFFILLAISLQNCNGQDKNKSKIQNQISKEEKTEQNSTNEPQINFLEEKYQKGGFNIPDTPNPYPTYSFSDSKIGAFTVDYIGKTNNIQDFWNVNNTKGYFSKYSNPEDGANKSDDIKKGINPKDYYIIASYLPKKYFSYNGGEDGEFDLKPDAVTYFYMYVDNAWKLIHKMNTETIPSENQLKFYTGLIQKDIFRNNNSTTKNFDGTHNVVVETSIPSAEIARSKYSFTINQGLVNLSLVTYLEPPICDGKYHAIEVNNVLEVYYAGEELSCFSIEPQFYIKKENNKFYIKSKKNREGVEGWLLMK